MTYLVSMQEFASCLASHASGAACSASRTQLLTNLDHIDHQTDDLATWLSRPTTKLVTVGDESWLDPLRDQFRVLDKIGRRIEAARHQDRIVGDFLALQILPFMRMAGISGLEQQRLRPRLDRDVEHRGERDVVGVRPLVIAPANV